MEQDIGRVLLAEQAIQKRVDQLAKDIAASYPENKDGIVIVCILAGSIVFLADLIRRLPMKMRLGLVTVTSYPGEATTSRGPVLTTAALGEIKGRDVLIVDDILDSGGTLRLTQSKAREAGANSVKTAVLLRKITKAPRDVIADFVGFDIEDEFVVGYGLDYDGLYRNLPYVAVLKRHLQGAATV
ncbi:MAG: hypoxanthine phosphoribosyltransferase [Planctomycetota bacterium]